MRKYTESEVRAGFEKTIKMPQDRCRLEDGKGLYVLQYLQIKWEAWLDCASFLGALSEAHKGETDK